jgi:hypothetical protein
MAPATAGAVFLWVSSFSGFAAPGSSSGVAMPRGIDCSRFSCTPGRMPAERYFPHQA